MRKLIETTGRLVANRNVPGSGVTAPYGTLDDTGKVQLSQETMARTGASDTALPAKSSKFPDRKLRELPMKKVSRVIDVQKNNQLKYTSLFQSIDLEPSSKPAATATGDITSDTG